MVKFFLAHKLSADLTSLQTIKKQSIYLQLTFPHSIVFSILLLNAVITMISDEVFNVKLFLLLKSLVTMSLPSTWRGSWWSPRRWSSPRPSGRRWSWSRLTSQCFDITLTSFLMRAWLCGSTQDTCPCQVITVWSALLTQCDMLLVWRGTECFVSASPTQPRPSRHAPAPQARCSDQQRARRSVRLLMGQLKLFPSSD